jgi:hypothetical protein
MKLFFSFCPKAGFETHDTAAEAEKAARESLDYLSDEAAGDGWNENVDQLCWGEITHMAVMTNRRPVEPDDNCSYDFDYICDYELTPLEELPE